MASSCGNRGAVSILLELNADPEAADRKGRVAGQSFLRQVSKRARADIREMLAAAVERRHSNASCGEAEGYEGWEHPLPIPPRLVKRASSTSSCEEAAPVRRPSLPSMLNMLPGFGGGSARGNGGGETSFGTSLAPHL